MVYALKQHEFRTHIFYTMLSFVVFANLGVVQSTMGQTINPPASRYNFVVILTDDQRWDTLWAMPMVQEKLMVRGVTFTNAFVTTPLCCPARASILAGGFYAHNTAVLTNALPNGGVHRFHDTTTVATILQNVGYKTALVGKYLNDYTDIAPYVPPGWTKFVAQAHADSWTYYTVVTGSTGAEPTQGELQGPITQYRTDFQLAHALEFLEHVGEAPFFLYFSTNAPHSPATPAPGDEPLFADYTYRGRAYGERNLSDKPRWVREATADFSFLVSSRDEEDEFHRNQLRSLQAVDRAVGAIVDNVAAHGKLDQTVFIFTSDNGYLWGEHGLFAKGKPYEESIRVPFVIVMPGIPARMDEHLVAVNLDIAPTLFDLVGIVAASDGMSLLPLLRDAQAPWRDDLLIEGYGNDNLFAGLRTHTVEEEWKYVEYRTGEKELYDLKHDPYEEHSRHADPAYQGIHDLLAARLAGRKGLAIIVTEAPAGIVGQPYSFRLRAWGGHAPYIWSILDQQLPRGLTLDRDSGHIHGIPVMTEDVRVSLQVQAAANARHTAQPQAFIEKLMFVIHPAPRLDRSLTGEDILNGSLTEAELIPETVTSRALRNGAVTTLKIKPKAVTASRLQDGAVTETKLAPELLTRITSLESARLSVVDGTGREVGVFAGGAHSDAVQVLLRLHEVIAVLKVTPTEIQADTDLVFESTDCSGPPLIATQFRFAFVARSASDGHNLFLAAPGPGEQRTIRSSLSGDGAECLTLSQPYTDDVTEPIATFPLSNLDVFVPPFALSGVPSLPQ